MSTTIVKKTLATLDKISKMGCIHPKDNAIQLYNNQVNHLFTDFFKATSVASEDALACMEKLTTISNNTDDFLSLFSDSMMNLYDQAIKGDLFTQRQAETKLLLFFNCIPPKTIEQKNRLLKQIQQMPSCLQREKEIAGVVKRLTDHYDQNQQFKEDPNLSVLVSLSDLLRQMSKSNHSRYCNGNKAQAKAYLSDCITMIKAHAPELCANVSQEHFHKNPPHRYNVPDIKEAVSVSSTRHYSYNRNSSRTWERE